MDHDCLVITTLQWSVINIKLYNKYFFWTGSTYTRLTKFFKSNIFYEEWIECLLNSFRKMSIDCVNEILFGSKATRSLWATMWILLGND